MDLTKIPIGDYCYEHLEFNPQNFTWHVRYCPYYRFPHDGHTAVCLLINETDDLLLNDQCKICNFNLGDL